jgi:hypothetical protein
MSHSAYVSRMILSLNPQLAPGISLGDECMAAGMTQVLNIASQAESLAG